MDGPCSNYGYSGLRRLPGACRFPDEKGRARGCGLRAGSNAQKVPRRIRRLRESAQERRPQRCIGREELALERVRSMSLVLAFSWQPAFCETASGKPECQSQSAGRYDTTHFSLHGLWPQPRSKTYCKVSRRLKATDKRGHWFDLPAVQTTVATREQLQKVMPGTRSALDRHEWVKHGTCYSRNAETYYRDSLTLMETINASSVRELFANNIGKKLTTRQIRAEFDKAFGRGVGRHVRVACAKDGKRQLIKELTLGLSGVVGPSPNLKRLTRWARSTKPGCPGGIVDAVGLQ